VITVSSPSSHSGRSHANPSNDDTVRDNKKFTKGVGKRKVKEIKDVEDNELVKLGLKLYDVGFNVIPVDSSKKPLTSWAYDKRIKRRGSS
jgi:hypothetical protein